MHVFPQLRKMEEKYADELVVIGVHSAKFPNEKYADNVLLAAQRYELKHPIVNDAEFEVWRQYACRAWPTLMFVDPEGKVIGKHEGELPYEAFDDLLGRMIAEFDDKGMIDRRDLGLVPEAVEESALAFPGKVLADGPGNRLFIADTNHNRIVVTDLDRAGAGSHRVRSGGLCRWRIRHRCVQPSPGHGTPRGHAVRRRHREPRHPPGRPGHLRRSTPSPAPASRGTTDGPRVPDAR